MASLNKVQIIGNVGEPPEMRWTPNGNAVTSFSVAVNRFYGGKDGSERKSEVEWFNVVCWDKLAESCNAYLSKGKLVYVEGRQKTRKWEGKDGTTHYKTELVANHAIFLERSAVVPVQEIEEIPPDPVPEANAETEELPF